MRCATRSVAASTHRKRRFSLAQPPKLTRTAQRRRTATTFRLFCPSPPASPRGTRQPQQTDPLHKGREQLLRDGDFRQLEGEVLGVGDHLGPDLDQLLPQRRQRPVLDGLGQYQCPRNSSLPPSTEHPHAKPP